MSPLVSIMTPCYNGEKFVGRYLDSVLAQTYDNIEVILVDDGSTDNTAAIVKSYIPKFDAKGYKLIYSHKKNGGAASAINVAMPLVNGDFITWFDSDDFFIPESISKRVKFLQDNPQFDFCICQMYEVNEKDLLTITKLWKRTPPLEEYDNFFADLLLEQNHIFPNVYLARREAFFKAHPTKKIFPSSQGQNWQILLPLAYRCKYGYVEEPLMFYVIRADSHAHSPRSYQQEAERYLGFIELLTATLKQLKMPNETDVLNFVWAKFTHRILMLGIKHSDANLIVDCCRQAEERNLDIFGAENFDVQFLLGQYIFPLMNLQAKFDAVKADISKINDKLNA